MTVNYMRPAATAKVGTFLGLLFRWRGSVWKSVWHELTLWLFIYFNISVIYRFFLYGTELGDRFESLVELTSNLNKDTINVVTFAMGFYVTQIFTRWWSVFMMIPWPDSLSFQICAYMRCRGRAYAQEDRLARRQIARYLALSFILVFRDISEKIKKRFPNYEHLVPNLMTTEECQRISKADDQRRHWLPIEWANLILTKAYKNKQIDEHHFSTIVNTLMDYRERLHNVMQYDWVNVPLVYTQVVHVLILAYFLISSIAAQPVVLPSTKNHDSWLNEFVIPVYAIFEFVFYVGWLKVAQVMINPFGMDDDDFDIDSIIERNLKLSYCCVDNLFDQVPKLVDLNANTLPHTKASAATMMKNMENPMIGSAAGINIPAAEQHIVSSRDLTKLFEKYNLQQNLNLNLHRPKIMNLMTSLDEFSAKEPPPRFTNENKDKEQKPTPDKQEKQTPDKQEKPTPENKEKPTPEPRLPSRNNSVEKVSRVLHPSQEPHNTNMMPTRVASLAEPEKPVFLNDPYEKLAEKLQMLMKVDKKRNKLVKTEDEEGVGWTQSDSMSEMIEAPKVTPNASMKETLPLLTGKSKPSPMSTVKTQMSATPSRGNSVIGNTPAKPTKTHSKDLLRHSAQVISDHVDKVKSRHTSRETHNKKP